MNFVIGDIHGEISKLRILIEEVLKMDSHPTLIFVGDYLDKGENPKKVLDFLLDLSKVYKCIFLKGNHEYYWSKYKTKEINTYLLKYGGKKTIESFEKQNVQDTAQEIEVKYRELIDQLIPYYIYQDYFICHSGIDSSNFEVPPEELSEIDFYFNRYKFIQVEKKYLNKYKVIFGHTGFLTPFVDEYKIGIDTAACFTKEQPLTAFCIENNNFVNSKSDIYDLHCLPKNSCPMIIRSKPWRQK